MRRLLHRLVLPLGLFLLPLAGCESTKGLEDYAADLSRSVENLLGSDPTPSEHLETLASVHVEGTWTLRRDVEDPLEQATAALRELAAVQYSGWDDAARVAQIVSEVATEHDFALMRVEAVDTLAGISKWTVSFEPAEGQSASEESMIEALKVMKDVTDGADDTVPTYEDVEIAVTIVSLFEFENVTAPKATAPLLRARRAYRGKLRTARTVLKTLTSNALDPYRGEPAVLAPLDDSMGRLSGAIVRLTLLVAVLGDDAETVRSAAAGRLAELRPRMAPDALGRVVRQDPSSAVRRDAVMALGAFDEADAVPPLLMALNDSAGAVRSAAVRALRVTTGQDLGADVGAWREYWESRSADEAPVPDAQPAAAATTADTAGK